MKPHLILPVGTRVVSRGEVSPVGGGALRPRGAVGAIIGAPADASHSYMVRLADGATVRLRRSEFSLLKHVQKAGFGADESGRAAGAGLDDFALREFIIYRCVIGSRAYGLEHDESDVDRRGVFLPPAEVHWSLYGPPEQIEDAESQETYWEIQKFVVLALKANPNVLECLYTPLVELAMPVAQELLAMRGCFLSRLIYQTFNGYVLSQFRKLEQDLRAKGAVRWKHAMHLIRLLLSGIHGLRRGEIVLRVEEHRDELLAIRRGELAWEQVDAWRLRLHGEFDEAFVNSPLPERPDYERVNDFLVRARRSMVR